MTLELDINGITTYYEDYTMKKDKVKVVKEKYYGFSLPFSLKEEQIIVEEIVQDVTVCLVLDDKGNWARGVTVFNREEDLYDEVIGRTQSRQYALRALKGRNIRSNEFERDQAINTLIRTKCPFTKKGQKNIDLSMYERGLLFGKDFQCKYRKLLITNSSFTQDDFFESPSSRCFGGIPSVFFGN